MGTLMVDCWRSVNMLEDIDYDSHVLCMSLLETYH